MSDAQKKIVVVILFLVIAGTILFWNLGQVPLFEPDEGRYADMSLTMLKTGDWLVPRMNYVTHLHKPPFFNWLVAGSFQIFQPSEFSARFPNVILSLLILLGSVGLGRFLFNFRSGFYGACILLTSVLYIAVSRLVTPDTALTFCVLLAMVSFAQLFFGTKNKTFFFYLLCFALGLGMFTKGPVAWMMSLLPALIFGLVRRRGFSISGWHWFLGVLLFLLLSFFWYLLLISKNYEIFNYFLNYQLLGRIKGGSGHSYPFYYYLIVLPLGFLPWSLLLPSAIHWNFKSGLRDKEEKDRFLFLVFWFLVPFLGFCFFKSKLATYIVPLLVPLALATGRFLQAIEMKEISWKRFYRINFWIAAVSLLVAVAGALVFVEVRPKFVMGIPPLSIYLLAALFILFVFGVGFALVKKRYTAFFKIQMGFLGVVALLVFMHLPLIHFKNVKDFSSMIQQLKKPGDLVMVYGKYYASLPFYLGERVLVGGQLFETDFESQENLKKYYFPAPQDPQFLFEGDRRIFILTTHKGIEKAQANSKKTLHLLLRQGKTALLSNQP